MRGGERRRKEGRERHQMATKHGAEFSFGRLVINVSQCTLAFHTRCHVEKHAANSTSIYIISEISSIGEVHNIGEMSSIGQL